MEDKEILTIITYSIINLLGYLLSIYFLTSLYYIKILSFYFENDNINLLNKQYKNISVVFSFQTIIFICFISSITIILYNSDLTIENNINDSDVLSDKKSELNKYKYKFNDSINTDIDSKDSFNDREKAPIIIIAGEAQNIKIKNLSNSWNILFRFHLLFVKFCIL